MCDCQDGYVLSNDGVNCDGKIIVNVDYWEKYFHVHINKSILI